MEKRIALEKRGREANQVSLIFKLFLNYFGTLLNSSIANGLMDKKRDTQNYPKTCSFYQFHH
jgi:hypothetical protein